MVQSLSVKHKFALFFFVLFLIGIFIGCFWYFSVRKTDTQQGNGQTTNRDEEINTENVIDLNPKENHKEAPNWYGLGIGLLIPNGWQTSIVEEKSEYTAEHPQFSYQLLTIQNGVYRIIVEVTTDPQIGGGGLSYYEAFANDVELSVAGFRTFRDAQPDLCADVEREQPDGVLCFFLSFLDKESKPTKDSYGYELHYFSQIEHEGSRYLVNYKVPKENYDPSLVKEMDTVVESLTFGTE